MGACLTLGNLTIEEKRALANQKAGKYLKESERTGAPITDAQMLDVIEHWVFRRNRNRPNVTPEGDTWVPSDTCGLVDLRDGTLGITKLTSEFPEVPKMICKWF